MFCHGSTLLETVPCWNLVHDQNGPYNNFYLPCPQAHCSAIIMTSSNGNIFRVTGLLCGEFTGPGELPSQRPVTRSCDVFFDMCQNRQVSKESRGWWSETPSSSLWRQRNATTRLTHDLYVHIPNIVDKFCCRILNNIDQGRSQYCACHDCRGISKLIPWLDHLYQN